MERSAYVATMPFVNVRAIDFGKRALFELQGTADALVDSFLVLSESFPKKPRGEYYCDSDEQDLRCLWRIRFQVS